MALFSTTARNIAIFSSGRQPPAAEALASVGHLGAIDNLFVVSDHWPAARGRGRRKAGVPDRTLRLLSFAEAGFLESPLSFRVILKRITDWVAAGLETVVGGCALVVDMNWTLTTNAAAANFETWMEIAERLSADTRLPVVSLYNRKLMIDEQLLTALRGHPEVLTGDGVHDNPHWLPARLLTGGTLRQQIDHWLNVISPDFKPASDGPEIHAAEGADPMWLIRKSAEEPALAGFETRDRWKIRCFGRLRIYRNDGSQVIWDTPGGATRKTKTLFAYLLQKMGEGAGVDELADLLWPEATSLEAARNRLYHTVRCLREVLARGGSGNGSDYVIRDSSRYVLVPPDKSWLDISTFEQLCRQTTTHIKSASYDEALICVQAADRLYTGDLFADIPPEYADDNERDWCWSKRYWLREMFFKVQQSAASIYRQRQDYSAALAHCHKALAIDPLCEIAHEEAMRVYGAQGRMEAIDRQFKLYIDSLSRFDDRPKSGSLKATYEALKRGAAA